MDRSAWEGVVDHEPGLVRLVHLDLLDTEVEAVPLQVLAVLLRVVVESPVTDELGPTPSRAADDARDPRIAIVVLLAVKLHGAHVVVRVLHLVQELDGDRPTEWPDQLVVSLALHEADEDGYVAAVRHGDSVRIDAEAHAVAPRVRVEGGAVPAPVVRAVFVEVRHTKRGDRLARLQLDSHLAHGAVQLVLRLLQPLDRLEGAHKVVPHPLRVVRRLILPRELRTATDVVEDASLHLLGAGRLMHVEEASQCPQPCAAGSKIAALHCESHDDFVALQVKKTLRHLAAAWALGGLASQLLEARATVDGLTALHLVRLAGWERADETEKTLGDPLGKL